MILVASYSETNQSGTFDVCSDCTLQGIGEAFQAIAARITEAKFFIKKSGTPTGNAVAKLYAVTGTYGVDARPTGVALATSDNFDVSTLDINFQLASFVFSGVNQFQLVNGTIYAVTFEYSGGNTGANLVQAGVNTGGTDPAGTNVCALVGATWFGGATNVCPFYVYGTIDVLVDLVGVAASPVIGTGTVQIQVRIPHATDGGLPIPRRSRTRVQSEGLAAMPRIGRPLIEIGSLITGRGIIAFSAVGGSSISVDSGVSLIHRRNYLIRSQINVTFDGQLMPSALVGTGIGSVSSEVDLLLEEIGALLQ